MSYPDAWLNDANAPPLSRERVLELLKESIDEKFSEEFAAEFRDKCKQGNHELSPIFKSGYDDGPIDVVQWCPVCGAVVIDIEVDGHIMAGRGMQMRFPKIVNEVDEILNPEY